MDINVKIHKVLLELGVPPHLLGYFYLASALEIANDNSELVHNFHKGILKEVGRKFDVTTSQIDRNIRHAIEKCYFNVPSNVWNKYFGNIIKGKKVKKLTPKEFVGAVHRAMQLGIS